jgi:hypothetical protein
MAANWSDVETLVKPLFEGGNAPERSDLMDYAFQQNADDDIVDALDTLSSRPVASLDALQEQLRANGAIA